MHDFVLQLRFRNSENNPCLYICHEGVGTLLIALHVDDLLIAGNSLSQIDAIKKKRSDRFEMKDMGIAKVILVVEI